MKHSRLAPSDASRWVNCPGSVVLQEAHPELTDSQDAADGDAAHWVGAQVLTGAVKEAFSLLHTPAMNSTVINQEMLDAAKVYIDYVRSVTGDHKLHVEEPVPVAAVHPECWGTPDCWWFDSATGTLHVFDFKYGWGIVEVFNNFQLLLYAIGILATVGASRLMLHVIQPRPYHPDGSCRSWEVKMDVLPVYQIKLRDAAAHALGLNPGLCTGPHCKNCTALYPCVAAQQASMNALDVIHRSTQPEIPPESMGAELTMLRRAMEIIKHRLAAAEETALAMHKGGMQLPGWTIGFTAGSFSWNPGSEAEVRAMAGMYGIKVDKAPELVTPTQAIKLGLPDDVVKMYATRSSGKAKMEPVNLDKVKNLLGGQW